MSESLSFPNEKSPTGRFRSRRTVTCPRDVQGLSSLAVRQLARLLSPHDDAGGDAETVRADFDGVRVPVWGRLPMLLEREGPEFWAEFDDPDSNGVRRSAAAHRAARS